MWQKVTYESSKPLWLSTTLSTMTYVSVRSYTVYHGEKVLFQGSLILVRLDSLDMYTLHEVNTKLSLL
jgi:hypothetical protein